jgi:hypothetical protein
VSMVCPWATSLLATHDQEPMMAHDVLAALRAFLRFATGCTEAEAATRAERVLTGLGHEPGCDKTISVHSRQRFLPRTRGSGWGACGKAERGSFPEANAMRMGDSLDLASCNPQKWVANSTPPASDRDCARLFC